MKYHRKSKAQRRKDRLDRLQKKQVTADMKLEYEKFLSENPQLKGNSPKKQLQRQLQKQRIKREYVKARRAGAEAKTAKETFVRTPNTTTGIAKKLQEIAAKNKSLITTTGIAFYHDHVVTIKLRFHVYGNCDNDAGRHLFKPSGRD